MHRPLRRLVARRRLLRRQRPLDPPFRLCRRPLRRSRRFRRLYRDRRRNRGRSRRSHRWFQWFRSRRSPVGTSSRWDLMERSTSGTTDLIPRRSPVRPSQQHHRDGRLVNKKTPYRSIISILTGCFFIFIALIFANNHR